MTSIARVFNKREVRWEAGGWIAGRTLQPEMGDDALGLLAHSAEPRPGNLRYALDRQQTYLLGELRNADGLLTLAEVRERLRAAAESSTSDADQTSEVCRDEVACALGETAYGWSPVEDHPDQWHAVATSPHGRCELTATIVAGGVEVCSRLASWEVAADKPLRAALARFLAEAHGRIRFARFVLQDRAAHVASLASADRLSVELPDSMAAVLAAASRVSREVRALTDVTLAKIYLEAVA